MLKVSNIFLIFTLLLYPVFSNAGSSINKIWVWEDTENNQFELEKLVSDYTNLGISIGGVIVDSPWQTYYNSLIPDRIRYPNLIEMIEKFEKDEINTFLWITPYINFDKNIDDLDVDAQNLVKNLSFNNGKKFPWWKGSGSLLDFGKENTEHEYFRRLNSEILDGISGFKVDMLAQPSKDGISADLWFLASRLWYNKVQGFTNKTRKKMLARGWGHQGGFHALPDDNLINWGGDYNGSRRDFDKQMRDLCISVATGYKYPMVEIGGYTGVHSDYKELRDYILVSNGFPYASIGGRNWKKYKEMIFQQPELQNILKNRDKMLAFFNKIELKCDLKDNTFESMYYYIVTSSSNKISNQKLFNVSSNKFELAANPGVFVKPGVDIILESREGELDTCLVVLDLNEKYRDGSECLESFEVGDDVLHIKTCSACVKRFEIAIDRNIREIFLNGHGVNFIKNGDLYIVD